MVPFIGQAPTLTNEVYKYLAELVYKHSRIRLGNDKHALVSGRVRKRLRKLGMDSFEAYCDLLRSPAGGEEIAHLIDHISTNHTHFFREIAHLDFLQKEMLPAVLPGLQRTRGTFRVWSAACSSGEEPYTIGIVLAEAQQTHGSFEWQIHATDISTRVLKHASEGIYTADRVKLPKDDWLRKYFQKGLGNWEGHFRVKDDIRQRIHFQQTNLLQQPYPVPRGQHVIFCRNVMIYFDHDTQQQLVSSLSPWLAPGGCLIVGHSESLVGIQHDLTQIHPGIYRRK